MELIGNYELKIIERLGQTNCKGRGCGKVKITLQKVKRQEDFSKPANKPFGDVIEMTRTCYSIDGVAIDSTDDFAYIIIQGKKIPTNCDWIEVYFRARKNKLRG